jgi:hypothetical protein
MAEQIARSVTAEPLAQSNCIEQMFGAMMAAQASSTQLLTKESNQDKEVTPPGTTTIPALPAPDVHKLGLIESNQRPEAIAITSTDHGTRTSAHSLLT